MPPIEVRIATGEDSHFAEDASRLIDDAAKSHDIARRDPAMLQDKIGEGHAVVAVDDRTLVGFAYFSTWEGGRFVSHSGLVVHPDYQGIGLGKRIKLKLFDASEALFPDAATMSLTTSSAVEKLNLSLGFEPVPLSELTDDPEFWKGCETCRNYAETKARGDQCCCSGMLRRFRMKDEP